jgi:tRNA pseudouridine32 synthase/23S rRNA pseudouridine746 synthase
VHSEHHALAVVHEDAHLLVLHKPAGLLTIPGQSPHQQDCLIGRARQRWPEALIVHRLDQATSGLVMLARGATMQKALGLALEQRQVHKRYEAVVHGHPLGQAGPDGWHEIDLPIRIDWHNRPRSIVDPVRGKASRTRWQTLGPGPWPDTSRLALEPLTGRTHQLRLHLAAIGHPIVGDPLYADPASQALSPRLLLHASALQLTHPATGQPLALSLSAPF